VLYKFYINEGVGQSSKYIELDVGWANPSNATVIMVHIAVPRKKKGQNSYPHKIDIPCNQFHHKSGKSMKITHVSPVADEFPEFGHFPSTKDLVFIAPPSPRDLPRPVKALPLVMQMFYPPG